MKQKILLAAQKRFLFLPHVIKQMSHPERMISSAEIKESVLSGDIIEEYTEDRRGESCLICHTVNNRVIHVVCAPKAEYLAIITAYVPNPEQWSKDYRIRR